MPHEIPTETPDGRPYRVFFVCGHMRSGTTWTAALMNLHPQVNCHGEGPWGYLWTQVCQGRQRPWLYTNRPGVRPVLEEAFGNMVRRTILALSAEKPEAQWIGDHTSRQLWPYVDGAPHFHIVRDGRDVATSWTFHQLRLKFDIGEPHRSAMSDHSARFARDPQFFSKHPEDLLTVESWVRAAARGWAEFWDTAKFVNRKAKEGDFNIEVCNLRYEELVADTERERSRMYRFLGLDPAQAAGISAEQKTAPGFVPEGAASHYRSGRPGEWRKYANDGFRRWFKEEAGAALIDAGYEKDDSW